MSYANGTPNYNLPQTVGSDKRDWSDTNQAFLALDTAVKTANDTASAAGTAASTAQTAANTADTKATNAQTAASGAQATATSAAELAQTAKNRADAAYTAAGNAATAASGAQQTADAALPKTSVVDNLTTNDATKALSAKQGKALNESKLANSRLTANGNNAQLSYVNGVYGFTIGGTFYPLGGGSMTSRQISFSESIAAGGGTFNVSISPAIANLSKCAVIVSGDAYSGAGVELRSISTNSVTVYAYNHSGAGAYTSNGVVQVIEWS